MTKARQQKPLTPEFSDVNPAPAEPAGVAIIPFHGPITREPNEPGAYISWDTHRDAIVAAFACEDIKAVVLDIDCPGGSPAETSLLTREIDRQAALHKKPVYAFVRGIAASGGYWLASTADKIYALPVSRIGSIGVVAEGFGYHKQLKKKGLERRVFTAGKNKLKLDPYQKLNPAHVKAAQAELKDIHKIFIRAIREHRGDRLNTSDKKIMSGATWLGRKALKRGLIDGIGDIMSVMSALMKSPVSFSMFKPVLDDFDPGMAVTDNGMDGEDIKPASARGSRHMQPMLK